MAAVRRQHLKHTHQTMNYFNLGIQHIPRILYISQAKFPFGFQHHILSLSSTLSLLQCLDFHVAPPTPSLSLNSDEKTWSESSQCGNKHAGTIVFLVQSRESFIITASHIQVVFNSISVPWQFCLLVSWRTLRSRCIFFQVKQIVTKENTPTTFQQCWVKCYAMSC